MPPSVLELLHDVLTECEFLVEQSSGTDYDSFLHDEVKKRAFVRSLEVVGEATKKLPQSIRDQHPAVQWRNMAGMRDVLIHDYESVDYEIVWDVVINKIPNLLLQMKAIIDEAKDSD